jgi:hypothetical protein
LKSFVNALIRRGAAGSGAFRVEADKNLLALAGGQNIEPIPLVSSPR